MADKYCTLAPNTFGFGTTPEASTANCRREYGAGMKDYDVWRCHPETTIDGMGGFSYPSGPEDDRLKNKPVLIKRVRKGKPQALPVE